MRKYFFPSLMMTAILILICSVIYHLLITALGRFAPGQGNGEKVYLHGRVVGYKLIGQKFKEDRYFWGRPSAVGYNASGSGGTNKGPSNPDYLKAVESNIDSFLVHNPEIKRSQIPSELVTYSGSGLDPDISPEAALIQVPRVARARHLSYQVVRKLVLSHIQRPLFGFLGPETVNVLELNVALDTLNIN